MRTYDSAVQDLNSLQNNASVLDAIRKSGGKLNERSLPEMREYCVKIGYQPEDFDRFYAVHVTGTKGKGSTSALTESALRRYKKVGGGNLRTGLYTSPHLMEVRERIRIDGVPLAKEKFQQYFYDCWDKWNDTDGKLKETTVDGLPARINPRPTYFRFLTLVAFHTFIQEKVDVAVVEVGVGGQYDSTNILVHPVVCGVTGLGLDHCFDLGATIPKIAWHKGGIFKSGVPSITSPQPQEGMEILKERSVELNSPLEEAPPLSVYANGETIHVGLAGDHQRINAALAVAMVRKWTTCYETKHGISSTWRENRLPDYVIEGLSQVRWPGRGQMIHGSPGTVTWFLDGAHTVESMLACSKWFVEKAVDRSDVSTERVLIFNCTNGRDSYNLLAPFAKYQRESVIKFSHVIFCTNVTYNTNTYKCDLQNNTLHPDEHNIAQRTIARAWNNLLNDAPNVVDPPPTVHDPLPEGCHVFNSIEDAVSWVQAIAWNLEKWKYLAGENGVLGKKMVEVLVTGSLHLVGGVMTVLEVDLM